MLYLFKYVSAYFACIVLQNKMTVGFNFYGSGYKLSVRIGILMHTLFSEKRLLIPVGYVSVLPFLKQAVVFYNSLHNSCQYSGEFVSLAGDLFK